VGEKLEVKKNCQGSVEKAQQLDQIHITCVFWRLLSTMCKQNKGCKLLEYILWV
jgi:hypothetical protein